MNARGAAILKDPGPCTHIVYPYSEESQVAEAVGLFVSSGLRKGDAALLIMLKGHFEPIREQLKLLGFDSAALEEKGQLTCTDAANLLSEFMFDGIVDEHRFKTIIGTLIQQVKTRNPGRQVRLFGEMVSLTWQTSPKATQRLEELWNEVIERHSVPLLCAYALGNTVPGVFPSALLACHSDAIA
jgi:hypothetical protein